MGPAGEEAEKLLREAHFGALSADEVWQPAATQRAQKRLNDLVAMRASGSVYGVSVSGTEVRAERKEVERPQAVERPPAAGQLPTAPPYDWGKTYKAAAHIEEHLPGLQLSMGVTTKATAAGFDVLSPSGDRQTV